LRLRSPRFARRKRLQRRRDGFTWHINLWDCSYPHLGPKSERRSLSRFLERPSSFLPSLHHRTNIRAVWGREASRPYARWSSNHRAWCGKNPPIHQGLCVQDRTSGDLGRPPFIRKRQHRLPLGTPLSTPVLDAILWDHKRRCPQGEGVCRWLWLQPSALGFRRFAFYVRRFMFDPFCPVRVIRQCGCLDPLRRKR